jgi:hypothetical protein
MSDYIVWPLDTFEHELYTGTAYALRQGVALAAPTAQRAALAVKGDGAVDRFAVLGPEGLRVFDLGDPAPDDELSSPARMS